MAFPGLAFGITKCLQAGVNHFPRDTFTLAVMYSGEENALPLALIVFQHL